MNKYIKYKNSLSIFIGSIVYMILILILSFQNFGSEWYYLYFGAIIAFSVITFSYSVHEGLDFIGSTNASYEGLGVALVKHTFMVNLICGAIALIFLEEFRTGLRLDMIVIQFCLSLTASWLSLAIQFNSYEVVIVGFVVLGLGLFFESLVYLVIVAIVISVWSYRATRKTILTKDLT